MKKSILYTAACFVLLTAGQALAQQNKPAANPKTTVKQTSAQGKQITNEPNRSRSVWLKIWA